MRTLPTLPYAHQIATDLAEFTSGPPFVLPTEIPARVLSLAELPGVGTVPPRNSPDWVSEYWAAGFRKMDQETFGPCTSCATVVAMQWCGLKHDGLPAVDLSWPFSYFVARNGWTDMQAGNSTVAPLNSAMIDGICLDSLDSETAALAAGHATGILPTPSAAAFTDALKRKIVTWSWIPADWITIQQVLAAGYPVPFVVGNHEVCAIAYTDNFWVSCIDSKMAAVGGVRVFNADLVMQGTHCVVTKTSLENVSPPPPPPGGDHIANALTQLQLARNLITA